MSRVRVVSSDESANQLGARSDVRRADGEAKPIPSGVLTASQTTATTAGFGRRHVSKVLFALAFVGVPAAVVMGSGGPHTLGFWWSAAAWLLISFYVALSGSC